MGLGSYMHKQVVEWGGKIFHKENFQEIFRGVENFSFPLFSEFWCFPSGFWCQNSYEGGKSAQNSKWGVENHHKDNPSKRGGKNFGNFLGGGKIFFLSMSLWLFHVCLWLYGRRCYHFRYQTENSSNSFPRRKMVAFWFDCDIEEFRTILRLLWLRLKVLKSSKPW